MFISLRGDVTEQSCSARKHGAGVGLMSGHLGDCHVAPSGFLAITGVRSSTRGSTTTKELAGARRDL